MTYASYVLLTALLTLFSFQAHAYELDEGKGYVSLENYLLNHNTNVEDLNNFLQDGSSLQKFDVALKALNVPPEADADFSTLPAPRSVSQEDVVSHFKFIDPESSLRRFLDLKPGTFTLYQDFFSNLLSQKYVEYSTELNNTNKSSDSAPLLSRLQTISNQAKEADNAHPLNGLKVAIDPGHMGTHFWDINTGKYVKFEGTIVSEGEINLWTALLVAKELESLGAIVKLTRTQMGTVSKEDVKTFNTIPYLNQFFYESFEQDWMRKLFHLNDDELTVEVKNTPEAKILQNQDKVIDMFYVRGADLEARSQIIDEFSPDITLDIHYDADDVTPTKLQTSADRIEAFIPGAFLKTETGSKKARFQAMKHLLEVRRWNESVDLSSEVVQAMSKSLNLKLLTTPTLLGGYKVRDGVYARNLAIARRLMDGLLVYVECLHYDHASEFYQMANQDQEGEYRGIQFRYPKRINDVTQGIKTGILSYFKNLKIE